MAPSPITLAGSDVVIRIAPDGAETTNTFPGCWIKGPSSLHFSGRGPGAARPGD